MSKIANPVEQMEDLGWRCDCRDNSAECLSDDPIYVDNFNEWTDYSNMEEYSKEADLKCKNCRKHRLPCYERGAKGLGHPYYDMPFKTCEGDSECCLKRFDIRTDKYVVDVEEDLMYCMVCAKDLLDDGKTIKYENAIKLIDPQKIDSNPKTITEDKIIEDTKMNANTNTNTPRIAPDVPSVPAEEFKKLAGITNTAIRGSNAQRNSGDLEVSEDLPLFMREGGEAEIEKRRKELETYLKLLNANPEQMIRGHTLVVLNPSTLDAGLVGEQQAKDIQKWFDTPKTKQEIREWLGCGTHKADGKSWNCGFMGSRWADKKINGRMVRFAFYADKDQKPAHLKHLAYTIAIDASN